MSNLAGREAVRKQLEQDRRAVAFRPALAEIGGGVTAGLLLSQAWY
jgi:hypothetical protein